MLIDTSLVTSIVKHHARQILLPRFHTIKRHYKGDGTVVTEADIMMQDALTNALADAYPDIDLLGEEMSEKEQRALIQAPHPFWCLDPLDGSSNFAAGLPFFCVSLALIVEQELVFGLVYDPLRDECFSAYRGHGASFNQHRLSPTAPPDNRCGTIAFIDFKHLNTQQAAALLCTPRYGSHRQLGSIALELCWLTIGRGHLYLHSSQHLWDYAGALMVLTELGLPSRTFSGEDVFSTDLACRSTISAADPDLYQQWVEHLSQVVLS
ncbi:MAG TPA: inositol monophosphatase [Gammaproteobacteria bacterium]|nr:inositol monophosphatase [Gammaproteobacteria bacterium]HAU07346.1 inositol monophosphatase [Gammaproteobacteria bacterium]